MPMKISQYTYAWGRWWKTKFISTSSKNVIKFLINFAVESSEASRRESTVSRSISDWNWTDTKSDDRISPGSSSINSSIFKVRDQSKN